MDTPCGKVHPDTSRRTLSPAESPRTCQCAEDCPRHANPVQLRHTTADGRHNQGIAATSPGSPADQRRISDQRRSATSHIQEKQRPSPMGAISVHDAGGMTTPLYSNFKFEDLFILASMIDVHDQMKLLLSVLSRIE